MALNRMLVLPYVVGMVVDMAIRDGMENRMLCRRMAWDILAHR